MQSSFEWFIIQVICGCRPRCSCVPHDRLTIVSQPFVTHAENIHTMFISGILRSTFLGYIYRSIYKPDSFMTSLLLKYPYMDRAYQSIYRLYFSMTWPLLTIFIWVVIVGTYAVSLSLPVPRLLRLRNFLWYFSVSRFYCRLHCI